MFQQFLKMLGKLFQTQPNTNPAERGIFRYDAKLKRMVKVADKPQEEGKYAMPLSEYLSRRNHLSKGSWRRPIDKDHVRKDTPQDDFGTAGCRNGHGVYHPKRGNRCIYCNLSEAQIEKIHQQDEKSTQ